MAKMRGIKPDFWISEQIVACSMQTRLFFIGLWNFSDDHGVFKWKPKMLKMQIFPSDKISVQKYLNELLGKGLLKKFTHEKEEYGCIVSFSKHQRIDKRFFKEIIPNFKLSVIDTAHVSTTSAPCVPHDEGEVEGESEVEGEGETEKEILKKKKFLDFVSMTQQEKDKLDELMGKKTTDRFIERLNNYIGSHGKKYKNHYFTIRSWWRKEKEKNSAKKERERAVANAPPPKPQKRMRYANPDLIP